MEKQFADLSLFSKRDVELFRSLNPFDTAIYFTDAQESNKNASAFFEILRFGLDGGDHQVYIRYPDTDYFVEIVEAGFGSSRGKNMVATGKNIWLDSYDSPVKIYSTENNLLLVCGNDSGLPEFNFMQKVASYNKGNKFNVPYPDETFFNYEQLEKALSMKYLKISESIRKIEYCFKTKDETPVYFLVDYPAYNFQYTNHRFFKIENEIPKEFAVENFARAKDGGTTFIQLRDENGNSHEFFSPTSLPEKILCEKYDDIELVEATELEKQKLVELLSITIEK